MPDANQHHPLKPTRPSVPEELQPRSVESHPGRVEGQIDDFTHDATVAHEESDVNVRAIGAFVLGLFVFGALVIVGLLVLIGVYQQRATAADPAVSPLAVPSGTLPPEPRLLTDEPGALRRAQAEEEATLKNIDAAKQAVVGTLPARQSTAPPQETPSRGAARMDTSSGRKQ